MTEIFLGASAHMYMIPNLSAEQALIRPSWPSKALFQDGSPGPLQPGSGEPPQMDDELARLKAENEQLWSDNHAKSEEIRELTERLSKLCFNEPEKAAEPIQLGEVSEEALRKRMERLTTPKADGCPATV